MSASGQPSWVRPDTEDRRGEPGDRADRQVDLAEQQHEHDADRDGADRRALQREVDEVVGRQEARVEGLEDAPDQHEADDDGQRSEAAAGETRAQVVDHRRRGASGPPRDGVAHRAGPMRRGAGSGGCGERMRVLGRAGDGGDDVLVAHVGCEEVAVVAAESQHDDPVGDSLHVGHVVADQHHPVAALAQPLDEVEHLGRLRDAQRGGRLVEDDDPRVADERSGDRDGLTLPPESAAIGTRTEEMRADSCRSSSQARLSISSSSSAAPAISRPRKRFATTSRLSHSARSWKTVAMPSPRDAVGSGIVTGCASNSISPSSAGAPRRGS